jgi:hypothetical protein
VRDDGSVGDAAMVEGDAVDGAADGATDGAPDETLAALPDAGAGDADGGP